MESKIPRGVAIYSSAFTCVTADIVFLHMAMNIWRQCNEYTEYTLMTI